MKIASAAVLMASRGSHVPAPAEAGGRLVAGVERHHGVDGQEALRPAEVEQR